MEGESSKTYFFGDGSNTIPASEDYQYLAGEIGKKMFKAAKELFCEECRKKYL